MSRRRSFSRGKWLRGAVALAITAFVIAVQRDTFVRRWLLPTRPALSTQLQSRVIPYAKIDAISANDAINQLSKASGVPIVVLDGPERTIPYWCLVEFRNTTVREALFALADHRLTWFEHEQAIALQTIFPDGPLVRSYDLGDRLDLGANILPQDCGPTHIAALVMSRWGSSSLRLRPMNREGFWYFATTASDLSMGSPSIMCLFGTRVLVIGDSYVQERAAYTLEGVRREPTARAVLSVPN